VEFLHEKYSKQAIGQKEYLPTYKSLYERQETRFICKFKSISMLWILDSQMNADP
jgi:hypothetical protein